MGKKYKCSVFGCNSRTVDFPGDFYCFPKNPTAAKAWTEACQRPPDPNPGEGGSIKDGQWVPNTAARSVQFPESNKNISMESKYVLTY